MEDLLQEMKKNFIRDSVQMKLEHLTKEKPQTSPVLPWAPELIFPRKNAPGSIYDYFKDHFPSLNVSPENYVATSDDDIYPLDLCIHHAIYAAFLKNKTDPLLKFLVVVIIVHDIGHALRGTFWTFTSEAEATEEFPYYREKTLDGVCPEIGFAVEIALFGGILGLKFKDEVEGMFPFFELDYSRIEYFFLTVVDVQVKDQGPVKVPITYKLGKEMIQSRMLSSRWLDKFEISDKDKVQTPDFLQHRLCAVLNSRHLARPDANALAKNTNAKTHRSIKAATRSLFPVSFDRSKRRCIIRGTVSSYPDSSVAMPLPETFDPSFASFTDESGIYQGPPSSDSDAWHTNM
ncbi:hypothetical protein B0H11DRAFT_2223308 [Mycena galericulata]|nr:hypothetical protein B0H11DRAFT_2223308 [Mycena galericulata]